MIKGGKWDPGCLIVTVVSVAEQQLRSVRLRHWSGICSVLISFLLSSASVWPLAGHAKSLTVHLPIPFFHLVSIPCANKRKWHHTSSDVRRPMHTVSCPVGSTPAGRCVHACSWTQGLARCVWACVCQRRTSHWRNDAPYCPRHKARHKPGNCFHSGHAEDLCESSVLAEGLVGGDVWEELLPGESPLCP